MSALVFLVLLPFSGHAVSTPFRELSNLSWSVRSFEDDPEFSLKSHIYPICVYLLSSIRQLLGGQVSEAGLWEMRNLPRPVQNLLC